MDRGAWYATVHGAAKSRTRLSEFTVHQVGCYVSHWIQHGISVCACTCVSDLWTGQAHCMYFFQPHSLVVSCHLLSHLDLFRYIHMHETFVNI